LHHYLPPALRPHVRLQRLDAQAFIIEVDSAPWAARLRFQLPQLRQWLQSHCHFAVPRGRLRVRPPLAQPAGTKPLTKPRLSQQNARHLRQQASRCNDPRLRAALYRLANHCTEKDSP